MESKTPLWIKIIAIVTLAAVVAGMFFAIETNRELKKFHGEYKMEESIGDTTAV